MKRSLGFMLHELALHFGSALGEDVMVKEWSFFASNHGKSQCDSRAANVKVRASLSGTR